MLRVKLRWRFHILITLLLKENEKGFFSMFAPTGKNSIYIVILNILRSILFKNQLFIKGYGDA